MNDLKYSEQQTQSPETLSELNPQELLQRIHAAETAIFSRLQGMRISSIELVEGQVPVAVEKLARQEFAEITLRQEALQAIFPPRLNIFYNPNLGFLQEKRVFQQPPLFATSIWK